MAMTSSQRLLSALRRQAVDRPPVVVPGGMMAGSLYSLVQHEHLAYQTIHSDSAAMAEYAMLLQRTCELDNYGVPFCMTIEAEDFGAGVDLGSPHKEPRVTRYPATTLEEVLAIQPTPCRRHQVTLAAIADLAGGDVPVIGNLIGPTSLLTSLVEPSVVYRAMAKNENMVVRVFTHLTAHLLHFAEQQIAAGADVIVLADPGSSGDIISGDHFTRLVAPFLREIVQAIKARGKPVVLHICGNVMPLAKELTAINWDALSVDSVVSLRKLQAYFPERTLMGNISTHLLAVSGEEQIYRASEKAVEVSAILAPACGLSTTTLPQNIRSMVKAAKDAAGKLPKRLTANE